MTDDGGSKSGTRVRLAFGQKPSDSASYRRPPYYANGPLTYSTVIHWNSTCSETATSLPSRCEYHDRPTQTASSSFPQLHLPEPLTNPIRAHTILTVVAKNCGSVGHSSIHTPAIQEIE
jgi:hypothetical protein